MTSTKSGVSIILLWYIGDNSPGPMVNVMWPFDRILVMFFFTVLATDNYIIVLGTTCSRFFL